MSWSTRWDLPEPLGQVRVAESALRHIFNEHMIHSLEYWESLLSTLLLRRLDQCRSGADAERFPVLDEVAAVLGHAVRQGLERPLFLGYDQLDPQRVVLHRTFEVVTASGHVFVIRVLNGNAELKTAFLPDAARTERPARRWIGSVRSRVELYAVPLLVDGRRFLGLPPAGHEVESVDPPGWRTNFRFESPRVWGFREFTPPGREEPLIVWSGRPLPWPG
jgi:hypothetical protein